MTGKKEICLSLIFVALIVRIAALNLCEDAKSRGFDYTIDLSDPTCTKYIYCSWNGSVLTNIAYGQCDQSGDYKYFDRFHATCRKTNENCTLSLECPSKLFKVARVDDCTSYRMCNLTSETPFECTSPGMAPALDRSSGTCIDNSNGFIQTCPRTPMTTTTTTTTTTPDPNLPNPCANVTDGDLIYVQDQDCTAYALCFGTSIEERGACDCDFASGNPASACEWDISCNPCPIGTTTLTSTTTDYIDTTTDSGTTTDTGSTTSVDTTTSDTTTSTDTTTDTSTT